MSLTLITVTNIYHDLAKFAIEQTLSCVPIDDIIVFSDKQLQLSCAHKHVMLPETFGRADYGKFICKELVNYIKSDHVMVVQYDGMAVRPQFWTDDYLDFDYIGGVFAHHIPALKSCYQYLDPTIYQNAGWYQDSNYVTGNGGFSIRSRKLLEALASDEFSFPWHGVDIEDFVTCIVYRDQLQSQHGIRFAPCDLGLRFSHELIGFGDNALGFHGWEHIVDFFDDETCLWYLNRLGSAAKEKSYRLYQIMCKSGHLPQTRAFANDVFFNHLPKSSISY